MLAFHKLRLREISEPCKLHGLTIKAAHTHRLNVDGTTLSIAFPKQSTRRPVEAITPKENYGIEGKHLKNLIGNRREWGCLVVARRDWDFYGPLWGGDLATLTFTMSIITPRDIEKPVSFFHPRSFEYILGELLTFEYGDELQPDSRPAWKAPEHWSPEDRFDSVCARYDVLPNNTRHLEYHRLSMPISDNHLLDLEFKYGWHPQPGDAPSSRDWLDRSEMYQLTNDIIESLQVDLSTSAKAQQQRALEGVEDTSLTPHYPPIKWGTTSLRQL